MPADLEPIRSVPCTYADCAHSFNTVQEMKAHKLICPRHFYCKKCDVDCASWEDLTQHKVDAMAPWLNARCKQVHGNPKHIVCEFCGEDFKSMGGRKRHREMMHRADQNVVCPGCQSIFVRAWMMIDHLERNQCTAISSYDFFISMQQKFHLKEFLRTGDLSNSARAKSILTNDPSSSDPSLVASQHGSRTAQGHDDPSDSSDDDGQGGVSLLDMDDAAQREGSAPLKSIQAEPSTNRNKGTWPALSQVTDSVVEKSLNRLSLTDASNDSSTQTKLRQAPLSTTKHDAVSDIAGSASAWQKGKAALTLFPDAKATPPTDATALKILEANNTGRASEHSMLKRGHCDVQSKNFDANRFYDSVLEAFCCPFPACHNHPGFDTGEEIRLHLALGHNEHQYQCPACLKVFYKPSRLIAHAEQTGKCKIAEANIFKQLIEDLSGGYLEAEQLPESILSRPQTGLEKPGQSNGIMRAEYSAKMPEQSAARRLTQW